MPCLLCREKTSAGFLSQHLIDSWWFFVDLAGCVDPPRFRVETSILIFGAVAILLFVYRKRQKAGSRWLAVLVLAPAALACAVSEWAPQSIWGWRHLIFALWPFIMVLADCLCQLQELL